MATVADVNDGYIGKWKWFLIFFFLLKNVMDKLSQIS